MRIGANRNINLPTPPPTPQNNENNNNSNNNNSNSGQSTPTIITTPTSTSTSTTSSTTSTTPTNTMSSKSSPNIKTALSPNNNNIPTTSHSAGNSNRNSGSTTPTHPNITGSQSKSSNALLQHIRSSSKAQTAGQNEIYQLLAEQKLTENDIWGGHPDLFPIFFQYHTLFDPVSPDTNEGGNVLSINFPSNTTAVGKEFGEVRKRSYKIGKKLTVAQTVNLICRKQQVRDPRRFWLSTQMGFVMNDDLLLSTYGFGTFYSSWELNLVYKDTYLCKIQTDSSQQLQSNNNNSTSSEYVVDFKLPPLSQFGGLKKKRIKVDSLLPISNIIEKICNKYKVEESSRFSLITNEDIPLVLNDQATLGQYGLGSTFATLELNIVFNEFIPPYSIRNKYIPTHGQYQTGPVDSKLLKAGIADLENKLYESMLLNQDMVDQIKKISADAKERELNLNNQINQMENSHNSIMSQIVDQLTKFKESFLKEKEAFRREIAELVNENELVNEELARTKQQMKEEIQDCLEKLAKEKSDHAETSLHLTHRLDQQKQENERLNSKLDEEIQNHNDAMDQNERERADLKQHYESRITSMGNTIELKEREKNELRMHYEARLGDINAQREEEEKRLNDIAASVGKNSNQDVDALSALKSIGSNNNSSSDNQEIEQLRSTIERLSIDLRERDVVIKTVYPRKIDTLESKLKSLESKYCDSEYVSAKRAVEIQQLQEQLDNTRQNVDKQRVVIETTTTQLREEERKHRKVQLDLSSTQNELHNEKETNQQHTQTISELERSKQAVELAFKTREAELLFEIEELKKPKPPPLPALKNAPKINDKKSDKTNEQEISDVKSLLKPIPNTPPPPREYQIATVADLLFVSMQKRFVSINQSDTIESLDDDDDDENVFDDPY